MGTEELKVELNGVQLDYIVMERTAVRVLC